MSKGLLQKEVDTSAMVTDSQGVVTEDVDVVSEKDRSKKDGANSPSLGSATSREEFVREQ